MRRALLALGLCVGCGVPPVQQQQEPVVTYEADLRPVLEASCVSCHSGSGIAPFALTSYESAKNMSGAMRVAVEERRMPPYLAGRNCAEYVNDISLSDEQIALFGKWVDQGFVKGEPVDTTSGPASQQGGLTRVDRTLEMSEPYVVKGRPDDYRCFVLDWPYAADKFVVGFNVVPGNPQLVHHVIAYAATPDRVQAVTDLDAQDPGAGYSCFGGPGAGIRGWLGAWAPGGTGSMYPPNTGLKVEGGSKVVLQVHYNTQAAPPDLSDFTHVEVALADTVEREAVLFLWTNPDWLNGVGMKIPAYEKNVKHAFAYDPSPYMASLTGGAIPNRASARIYSATVHQHLLGRSSRLEILNGTDNRSECLVDIPRWDFHWQRSFGFKQPKVLRPGDRLSVTCRWDNSEEAQPSIAGIKQTPHDVKWGEGTGDEMCLGIMYMTQ